MINTLMKIFIIYSTIIVIVNSVITSYLLFSIVFTGVVNLVPLILSSSISMLLCLATLISIIFRKLFKNIQPSVKYLRIVLLMYLALSYSLIIYAMYLVVMKYINSGIVIKSTSVKGDPYLCISSFMYLLGILFLTYYILKFIFKKLI